MKNCCPWKPVAMLAFALSLSSCAIIEEQAEKKRLAEERATDLAEHQTWRARKG